MEANKLKKDMTRFAFHGYHVFLLEKGRNLASGTLVGAKNSITSSFEIIKPIGESNDKIEIALLNCWMSNCHFKNFSVYNPPNNKTNLDFTNVNRRTIVIGDFNAHSQKWGYRDRNLVCVCGGMLLRIFYVQIIWSLCLINKMNSLFYSAASSNPELLMVSTDILDTTPRIVMENCDSDHHMVLTNIDLLTNRASHPCNRVS